MDPATARLMRWVMQELASGRHFFNRFPMGLSSRVQLDLVPALACGAHLCVIAEQPPAGVVDYVRAGVAMQRLWLTAQALGLHMQPR